MPLAADKRGTVVASASHIDGNASGPTVIRIMMWRVAVRLTERGNDRVGVEVLTLGEQGRRTGLTEISEGVEKQGDERKRDRERLGAQAEIDGGMVHCTGCCN